MNLFLQLQELQAAEGDPARLALASVELALPNLTLKKREAIRAALLAASVPHWCDPPFLAALLAVDEQESEKLFSYLNELIVVEPFLARGERAINVHESARLNLREYLRLHYPKKWLTISKRARAYLSNNHSAHARIEALHHLFAINQDAAVSECKALDRRLNINPESEQALALSLREMTNAGWLKGSALLEALLIPLEVRLHRGETPQLDEALKVMTLAESISDHACLARAKVIKAAIEIRQGNIHAALTSLQETIEIREDLHEMQCINHESKEDFSLPYRHNTTSHQSRYRPKEKIHTSQDLNNIKSKSLNLHFSERKHELMNGAGFTPARQQTSDEGFSNNYNIPDSLVQFRNDIQKQTSVEIRAFLELIQRHTECQLCSLFLIDDDGYLKCSGFYGFDAQGKMLSQKFFLHERYSDNYEMSAVAQAVKPNHSSRYGRSLLLSKDDINNSVFIDQENRLIIEQICGSLTSVVLTPVNGPNRSYGVIRIMKTEHYSQSSSISSFTESDVLYLELAAAQLAANLRDINGSQKLTLVSFMNRANLGVLGATASDFIQDESNLTNDQRTQAPGWEILEYLTNITEHLAHSQESCVKAATLRLFSRKRNGLVTIAASSNNNGQLKDTSIRLTTDYPKPLVIRVYEDGIDCTITDLQKEIDSSRDNYHIQNKTWLSSCNFKSLVCLAIKSNKETIGTLVLYNGHKQVIASRDRVYFRVIADSISEFISIVFYNNRGNAFFLDSFIDLFSAGELLPNTVSLGSLMPCYNYYSLIGLKLTASDYKLVDRDDLAECILELDRILYSQLSSSELEKALARLVFNSLTNTNIPYILARLLSLRHYSLSPGTIKYIAGLISSLIANFPKDLDAPSWS
jgi:hypothetical protein